MPPVEEPSKDARLETKPAKTEVSKRPTSISESWVRPEGIIERNIRMDIVVSASKKPSRRDS